MRAFLQTLLLGLLACLLVPLSCGREGGDVTLMIGGAPAEIDYWETIVSDFSDETGIAVSIMRQPTDTDQRRQSLIVPLKAGETDPDAFLMDIIWIGQFAASGWLESLNEYITEDDFDLSPFFAGIIDFADRFDNKIVAMPVYVDAGLLYYRSDLLTKHGFDGPPETWGQLVEMSRKIQAEERKANPDFTAFVWQGAQYEGLVCTFLEFALSNDGSLVDDSGRLTLARQANIEALRFMESLISEYRISPPNTYTEMKEEEVRSFFESGKAVFERNWPYAWGLHQSASSPVKDRVGISLLPRFEGGRHVAALGGWHIGISQTSDNKQHAWELVKFITSRETQLGFALNLGWNPSRRDIYDSSEIQSSAPHLAELKEIFLKASARPNLPYYSLLSKVLQRDVNAALSGIKSPEQALRDAQSEAEATVRTYER